MHRRVTSSLKEKEDAKIAEEIEKFKTMYPRYNIFTVTCRSQICQNSKEPGFECKNIGGPKYLFAVEANFSIWFIEWLMDFDDDKVTFQKDSYLSEFPFDLKYFHSSYS